MPCPVNPLPRSSRLNKSATRCRKPSPATPPRFPSAFESGFYLVNAAAWEWDGILSADSCGRFEEHPAQSNDPKVAAITNLMSRNFAFITATLWLPVVLPVGVMVSESTSEFCDLIRSITSSFFIKRLLNMSRLSPIVFRFDTYCSRYLYE